jgi:excisionase family DNA binding protein
MRREQDAHERNGAESLARVPEVARFLSLSRSKVYAMMDAGELKYVKLGKSRRLRWSDVMALVEANTVSGASGAGCSATDGRRR